MNPERNKKISKTTFHFPHPTQSQSGDASQESLLVLEELKAVNQ